MQEQIKTIGEIVREQEQSFVSGTTELSKYVSYSMNDTLNTIDAYSNSKHTSGLTDSLGREKPFFNIVTAATNIWYRATDIDRKNIRIKATKSKDWLDSFVANVHLQRWMRTARFGVFLNRWGRTLAKYGSAVLKKVENNDGLHVDVIPWSRLIVDPVDIDAAPVIEIIELSPSQLRARVKTHGYDKKAVQDLIDTAKKARETKDRRKKDNLNNYIKIYEVHGEFQHSLWTDDPKDADIYSRQMHVISFVGSGKKGNEHRDFTLYKGLERSNPHKITHLIEEEDRTLAKGAVEHLFESQWMMNHTALQIKNQLDLASKLIFQTADINFVGQNALAAIETGDILIHAPGSPLNIIPNNAHDVTSLSNFGQSWKSLANEIVGISDAMLGASPKSGTAWRQTEAVLQESYNLFELMTENKGLAIEDMMREWIIPYIKKQMDTSEEVAATLEQSDIDRIDPIYIKNIAIEEVNKKIKEMLIEGKVPTGLDQEFMIARAEGDVREMLAQLGNQRFFKPSELSDKTWKEQFKDLAWEVEVDVTGEATNTQEALATLNTALKVVVTPGFEQNKKAQAIVGKILEHTGAMSPIEYNAIPAMEVAPAMPTGAAQSGEITMAPTAQ